ncbi:MAG: DUF3248 domain-containing protein [Actinobacteria bacterium]|nr:MAG: DUF3248 domain-containing protein [Actinomycetota bacterium]
MRFCQRTGGRHAVTLLGTGRARDNTIIRGGFGRSRRAFASLPSLRTAPHSSRF